MSLLARLLRRLFPRRHPAPPDPLLIEMRYRTAEYDARLRRLLTDEAAVFARGRGEERWPDD